MSIRRILSAVTVIAAVFCGAVPQASAAQAAEDVTGSFLSAVPCIPTAYDSATGHTTCTGGSAWTGTLTGATTYDVDADVDPVTGGGTGTITETFTGQDTEGRVGTLHFTERFTLVPAGVPTAAAMTIAARIDGATGDFTGAQGGIDFFGTNTLVGNTGGYDGRLRLSPR